MTKFAFEWKVWRWSAIAKIYSTNRNCWWNYSVCLVFHIVSYDSKQSVESCDARISFEVSSVSWPASFLVLFFHAAFPFQFKVTFPTVTKFMHNVLVFKTCPVSEWVTAFPKRYFTIIVLNYFFICLDYFLLSINFLKIYLTTSIPGVIGSWSTQGCKVKET